MTKLRDKSSFRILLLVSKTVRKTLPLKISPDNRKSLEFVVQSQKLKLKKGCDLRGKHAVRNIYLAPESALTQNTCYRNSNTSTTIFSVAVRQRNRAFSASPMTYLKTAVSNVPELASTVEDKDELTVSCIARPRGPMRAVSHMSYR